MLDNCRRTIEFDFEGQRYRVSCTAQRVRAMRLSDGRTVVARSWSAGFPAVPSGVMLAPHLKDRTDLPIAVAVQGPYTIPSLEEMGLRQDPKYQGGEAGYREMVNTMNQKLMTPQIPTPMNPYAARAFGVAGVKMAVNGRRTVGGTWDDVVESAAGLFRRSRRYADDAAGAGRAARRYADNLRRLGQSPDEIMRHLGTSGQWLLQRLNDVGVDEIAENVATALRRTAADVPATSIGEGLPETLQRSVAADTGALEQAVRRGMRRGVLRGAAGRAVATAATLAGVAAVTGISINYIKDELFGDRINTPGLARLLCDLLYPDRIDARIRQRLGAGATEEMVAQQKNFLRESGQDLAEAFEIDPAALVEADCDKRAEALIDQAKKPPFDLGFLLPVLGVGLGLLILTRR